MVLPGPIYDKKGMYDKKKVTNLSATKAALLLLY